MASTYMNWHCIKLHSEQSYMGLCCEPCVFGFPAGQFAGAELMRYVRCSIKLVEGLSQEERVK